MSDDRLSDLEAIQQLRARITRHIDLQEWDEWSALLTDDYRLEAEGSVRQGREQIVAFVSAALTGASTVHQLFAPDITFNGPDAATATWGYEDRLVLPSEPTPVVLHGFGYLTDEYVRTELGWR